RHPSQLRPAHLMRRVSSTEIRSAALLYDFVAPGELLVGTSNIPVFSAYWPAVSADAFALKPRLALAAQ
ncbi:MAG: FMN-binding glutamate synthase family protein, partial [Alphaproteobacteria bacterium]|nr:FMN-binding glutamate synthase family protein [Alphaproteobacteria bacterium]